MRKIHLSLLLIIVALATGCPKYKPPVDFNNPNSVVNKLDLNDRLKTLQDRYWCYRFGFDFDGTRCTGTVNNGPERAKALRNEFLETAIPYLDDGYVNYIAALQAGQDRDNFIADLVELGTTAAIGITNGERPLQILGIGLNAFKGARRSADLNFYKEQSIPILINKMDDNRAKVRETILRREKDDVDTYPIGAAISDIVDYYNAGTLVRAFTQLAKDTAADARESEERVLELKGVPISKPATVEFRNLSVLASDIRVSIEAELGDATKKDDAIKKLQKIFAALEKDPEIAGLLKIAKVSSQDTDGDKLMNALIDIRAEASLKDNKDLLNRINQAIVDNGR